MFLNLVVNENILKSEENFNRFIEKSIVKDNRTIDSDCACVYGVVKKINRPHFSDDVMKVIVNFKTINFNDNLINNIYNNNLNITLNKTRNKSKINLSFNNEPEFMVIFRENIFNYLEQMHENDIVILRGLVARNLVKPFTGSFNDQVYETRDYPNTTELYILKFSNYAADLTANLNNQLKTTNNDNTSDTNPISKNNPISPMTNGDSKSSSLKFLSPIGHDEHPFEMFSPNKNEHFSHAHYLTSDESDMLSLLNNNLNNINNINNNLINNDYIYDDNSNDKFHDCVEHAQTQYNIENHVRVSNNNFNDNVQIKLISEHAHNNKNNLNNINNLDNNIDNNINNDLDNNDNDLDNNGLNNNSNLISKPVNDSSHKSSPVKMARKSKKLKLIKSPKKSPKKINKNNNSENLINIVNTSKKEVLKNKSSAHDKLKSKSFENLTKSSYFNKNISDNLEDAQSTKTLKSKSENITRLIFEHAHSNKNELGAKLPELTQPNIKNNLDKDNDINNINKFNDCINNKTFNVIVEHAQTNKFNPNITLFDHNEYDTTTNEDFNNSNRGEINSNLNEHARNSQNIKKDSAHDQSTINNNRKLTNNINHNLLNNIYNNIINDNNFKLNITSDKLELNSEHAQILSQERLEMSSRVQTSNNEEYSICVVDIKSHSNSLDVTETAQFISSQNSLKTSPIKLNDNNNEININNNDINNINNKNINLHSNFKQTCAAVENINTNIKAVNISSNDMCACAEDKNINFNSDQSDKNTCALNNNLNKNNIGNLNNNLNNLIINNNDNLNNTNNNNDENFVNKKIKTCAENKILARIRNNSENNIFIKNNQNHDNLNNVKNNKILTCAESKNLAQNNLNNENIIKNINLVNNNKTELNTCANYKNLAGNFSNHINTVKNNDLTNNENLIDTCAIDKNLVAHNNYTENINKNNNLTNNDVFENRACTAQTNLAENDKNNKNITNDLINFDKNKNNACAVNENLAGNIFESNLQNNIDNNDRDNSSNINEDSFPATADFNPRSDSAVRKVYYTKLSDLTYRQIVNICGLVVYCKGPLRTSTGEFLMQFGVKDESLHTEKGIMLLIFAKSPTNLPANTIHSYISIEGARVQSYQSSLQIVANERCRWAIFAKNPSSQFERDANFSLDNFDRTPIDKLDSYYIALNNAALKSTLKTTSNFSSLNTLIKPAISGEKNNCNDSTNPYNLQQINFNQLNSPAKNNNNFNFSENNINPFNLNNLALTNFNQLNSPTKNNINFNTNNINQLTTPNNITNVNLPSAHPISQLTNYQRTINQNINLNNNFINDNNIDNTNSNMIINSPQKNNLTTNYINEITFDKIDKNVSSFYCNALICGIFYYIDPKRIILAVSDGTIPSISTPQCFDLSTSNYCQMSFKALSKYKNSLVYIFFDSDYLPNNIYLQPFNYVFLHLFFKRIGNEDFLYINNESSSNISILLLPTGHQSALDIKARLRLIDCENSNWCSISIPGIDIVNRVVLESAIEQPTLYISEIPVETPLFKVDDCNEALHIDIKELLENPLLHFANDSSEKKFSYFRIRANLFCIWPEDFTSCITVYCRTCDIDITTKTCLHNDEGFYCFRCNKKYPISLRLMLFLTDSTYFIPVQIFQEDVLKFFKVKDSLEMITPTRCKELDVKLKDFFDQYTNKSKNYLTNTNPTQNIILKSHLINTGDGLTQSEFVVHEALGLSLY